MADNQAMSLVVNPLPGALGAEITGARLARPAAEATVAELRRALLDHLVVVVRGHLARLALGR